MSWTVNCIKNTIKAPNKRVLKELQSQLDECDYALTIDPKTRGIEPDIDAREHIDFISNNDEILEFMIDAGFTGELCFADFDQGTIDNGIWGHSFENGQYTRLHGDIHWTDASAIRAI